MKLEDASPFLRVNVVARRARQLLLGAAPHTSQDRSRPPTAIALAELRAGSLKALDPDEARKKLAQEVESAPEEERAASEAARVAFEEMWSESPAKDPSEEEAGDALPGELSDPTNA